MCVFVVLAARGDETEKEEGDDADRDHRGLREAIATAVMPAAGQLRA